MMQLGLAIGACSVGLAWLISESVRRWFKQRADARLWEAIMEATPNKPNYSNLNGAAGWLTDEEAQKLSTVFGQDTTLPQAKTRKRKRK